MENIKIIINNNKDFYSATNLILNEMNFNDKKVLEIIEKKIAEDSIILNESKMKKFIIYFFSQMIFFKTSKKIQISSDEYNLEHIIPENPKWTNTQKNEDTNELFNLWFINANRIKNLALIESFLNEKLENKFYWEKRKLYNEIKKKDDFINFEFLETTDEIFKTKKFEQEELNNRFKEIKHFSKQFAKNILNWKK